MNIPQPPAPIRSRPAIEVDVVMRREPVSGPMSHWQPFRWVLADVLLRGSPDETAPEGDEHDHEPQAVVPVDPATTDAGGQTTHWLFPRFRVSLFRDDAEGYFLNLNSPQPCFWVFWRADEERLLDGEAMAVPQIVTLSYHDAGRWLDAQERVDQVSAAPEVVDWLRGFVDATYQPEPKRRQRPESFKPLTDRFGQPVRVTTEKRRGGGGPPGL
ncbi:MAG: DUF3305 domain-containing protein [Hydrogenophaga sp.]|uniref:DUF3305 domain-containing protein n=1 Tax=Hydrogenophaga sp. TaxID=1904254 RepID=UPI0026036ECE|nr:DUF3305 domain-containing protein [Hydrogenophaga sp.]MDM7941207.1 DUF3305 domain-containing protein [Hydrogenophaga sp.]